MLGRDGNKLRGSNETLNACKRMAFQCSKIVEEVILLDLIETL